MTRFSRSNAWQKPSRSSERDALRNILTLKPVLIRLHRFFNGMALPFTARSATGLRRTLGKSFTHVYFFLFAHLFG
jgi:hypothetical protein